MNMRRVNEDTVAAIATAPGRGAIGIVRISGPGALGILKKVWKSHHQSVEKFATHRIYLGNIVDLSTGKTIDRVLASYMKGPHSYTGEDTVEISSHGGDVVLGNILRQVLTAGARPAAPGEFTKRAFLNNKLDLIQAEGVAALINSCSTTGAKIATEQLEGILSRQISEIKDGVKEALAFIEATIDFPEEEIEFIQSSDLKKKILFFEGKIEELVESYSEGRLLNSGVKVVIAGPPNAGKSSLLNVLLGFERAIVHRNPGTTRDTVEGEMLLNGIVFRLVDTAGIREAEEEVEEMGVERSKKAATTAEAVIIVIDGNNYKGLEKKFVDELSGVEHVFIVVNKSDLAQKISEGEIRGIFGKRPVCLVSAKTGAGVEGLRQLLAKEMTGGRLKEAEGNIITSERHYNLLLRTRDKLGSAIQSMEKREPSEFLALHLRGALDSLGEMTGEVTTDAILDEIFSKFCIGK